MHNETKNEYEFIEAPPIFARTINECCTYDGLFKTDRFDDRSYREEFERRSRASNPVGAYYFKDVELTGSWMLISTKQCRTAYNLLPGMGWTQQHIDLFLTRQKIHHLRTRQECADRDVSYFPGKYVLLAYPGAFTYGHFLVDISIRIQLAKSMRLDVDAKFLIPSPIQSWFLPFLSLAGISIDDCVTLGERERARVEQLFVPTLTGDDGVLHRSVAEHAFKRIKEVMSNILGPKGASANLLFPLHTPMSSQLNPTQVEQREYICDVLRERFGIEAFNPLQMNFAQQVDKFRHASLVVGENSSALHNILWSDRADLVVISPFGRMNFYHIGIQSLNGGRTAILWGDSANPATNRFRVDIDSLCRTITALIQDTRHTKNSQGRCELISPSYLRIAQEHHRDGGR